MNFAFFVHSLASDWNHGNAHFVRGVLAELVRRGHDVSSHEQTDNWSRWNLVQAHDPDADRAYLEAYPDLVGVEQTYTLSAEQSVEDALDLPRRLAGVDVVVVHEWTPPAVVAAVGAYRKTHAHLRLLFHDTHHRIVSEPVQMRQFDLTEYDGVLAFGDVLRQAYERQGLASRAWTWHEAANTHVFKPMQSASDTPRGDLCWVGNWGDDERTVELHQFLLGPVSRLGLDSTVHGVRYPDDARAALEQAGIRYGGYLPNFRAPDLFAHHRVTVHVPRRYYVDQLPGIPTIRPFEALACGIPLVSAPWRDTEHLFMPGKDFLMVDSGAAMQAALSELLADHDRAQELSAHGLETIRSRHTCAHRVDELMTVLEGL